MFVLQFAGSLPTGDRDSEARVPAVHSLESVANFARTGSRVLDVVHRLPCGTRAECVRGSVVRR